MTVQNNPAAIFCDGGVIGANPSPLGGTWATVMVDRGGGMLATAGGLILPGDYGLEQVTNNVAELVAMLYAIEAWGDGQGLVYSDSEVTIGRVFLGWAMRGVPPQIVAWFKRLQHNGKVNRLSGVLVGGHPTRAQLARGTNDKGVLVSRWNVECDRMCTRIGTQYLESLPQKVGGVGIFMGTTPKEIEG